MLSQHRVFRLSQLASLRSTSLPDTATSTSEWVATPTSTSSGAAGTSPSEVILDVAVSRTGEALVVVTGSTERPSLSILVTPCEENDLERKGRGKRPVKCWRRVPWLESGDLVPRCVTFSPGNDFVLIVVRSGGLYVIPTPLLFDDLLPVASKGECAGFLVWQNVITFFYCALYFFLKFQTRILTTENGPRRLTLRYPARNPSPARFPGPCGPRTREQCCGGRPKSSIPWAWSGLNTGNSCASIL